MKRSLLVMCALLLCSGCPKPRAAIPEPVTVSSAGHKKRATAVAAEEEARPQGEVSLGFDGGYGKLAITTERSEGDDETGADAGTSDAEEPVACSKHSDCAGLLDPRSPQVAFCRDGACVVQASVVGKPCESDDECRQRGSKTYACGPEQSCVESEPDDQESSGDL